MRQKIHTSPSTSFILSLLVVSLIFASFGHTVTVRAAGTGTGIKGYYFNNMDFSVYKAERLDSRINFSWGSSGPGVSGVSSDRFSVRWLGKVQPLYSEVYSFYTYSDDGVRLWVDNQLIVDKWVSQGTTEHAGSIRLNANQLYDIKLEYFENTVGSTVALSWSSPGQTKQIIPTSQLYPPGTILPPTPPPVSADLFGVNISGAEFGSQFPGTLNKDYLYSAANYKYFSDRKQKLIRIPFSWERVQPQAGGNLSAPNMAGLKAMLDAAAVNGQKVILDLHNYGRYYDVALKKSDASKLADVWSKISLAFKAHPALYGYELMNEPHDLPEGSDAWAVLAQAATNAIRQNDTSHYVIVPGYDWQSALRWQTSNPTLDINDSANKLLYSAHVYFDKDQSGRYVNSYAAENVTPKVGVDRLQPFISWLKSKNKNGIITEYGVPDNDSRYLTALDNFLLAIKNEAVLVGGTYWGTGPWWGSYALSVEPRNGVDRPQMTILKKY